MNSADGTTADTGGVKVFFNSGPMVTSGSGTATLGNADGTGTFTAGNQPFFRYASGSVLASGSTSAAKSWQLNVPTTVGMFSFTVYVTAQLPADSSVLRWVSVASPTTNALRGVSMNRNPTTGFAVGDNGTILYYDGATRSAVNTGLSLSGVDLYGVAYRGNGFVYAVGDGGTIIYSPDNGLHWALQTSGVA